MLVLPGSSALSEARFALLATRISQLRKSYRLREVAHAYAVELGAGLDVDELRLAALLQPGTSAPVDPAVLHRSGKRIVSPRFGTISPWSSKATDIARNCGFESVKRIERVTVYGIDGMPENTADTELDALIHDRMVETVVGSMDALAPLFTRSAPQSYTEVDVLGGGQEALAEAGIAPSAAYNIVDGAQRLPFGSRTFTILPMPGHSPGSVAIYVDGMLFLGDSAFAKEDGRIDLAPAVFGDDLVENRRSLVRLSDWVLDNDINVERMFFSHTGSLAGADALHTFADAHRDLL